MEVPTNLERTQDRQQEYSEQARIPGSRLHVIKALSLPASLTIASFTRRSDVHQVFFVRERGPSHLERRRVVRIDVKR